MASLLYKCVWAFALSRPSYSYMTQLFRFKGRLFWFWNFLILNSGVFKISLFLWTIDLHVHESTTDTSFDLLFSLYLVLNFHTTREEQLLPRHSAITGLQNKIHERCLTSDALSFYGSKTILDRPNHFGRVPIVLDRSKL